MLSEFGSNKSKFDGLSCYCKTCHAEKVRTHYATSAKYREQTKRRAKKLTNKRLILIYQHLLTHPCVDCGETDVMVLDFDHINPKNKSCGVTELARKHASWKIIEQEIKKCVVRCANCHRRRTAKQFNGYSLLEEAKRGLLIDSDVSVS